MFTKVITLLTLMVSLNGTAVTDHNVYMRGMVVSQLDYSTDLVTCTDSVGFQWAFYGCEDYAVGDIVCALMDTMGTEDTIFDDAILCTNYSGYWMD